MNGIRRYKTLVLILSVQIFTQCDTAKILAVFTAPSISHQVVFRPYTQELAKLGHEVVVVTTDPAFRKGDVPKNFTEIDIHDLLYTVLGSCVPAFKMAEGVSMYTQYDAIFDLLNKIGNTFFASEIIYKLKAQNYDLLIIEAFHKMILPLSHILQVPVIQISSFGSMFDYETVGANYHPVLYPEVLTQRIQNHTITEKIHETIMNIAVKDLMYSYEEKMDMLLRKSLPDMPSLSVLRNKVTTILLNVHSIWEENRPVPVGVAYVSGIHRWPEIIMSQVGNQLKVSFRYFSLYSNQKYIYFLIGPIIADNINIIRPDIISVW